MKYHADSVLRSLAFGVDEVGSRVSREGGISAFGYSCGITPHLSRVSVDVPLAPPRTLAASHLLTRKQ